jgi:hypothetical protein
MNDRPLTSNLVAAARELLRLKDLKTDANAIETSGSWSAVHRRDGMLAEYRAKKGDAWDALRRALNALPAGETSARQEAVFEDMETAAYAFFSTGQHKVAGADHVQAVHQFAKWLDEGAPGYLRRAPKAEASTETSASHSVEGLQSYPHGHRGNEWREHRVLTSYNCPTCGAEPGTFHRATSIKAPVPAEMSAAFYAERAQAIAMQADNDALALERVLSCLENRTGEDYRVQVREGHGERFWTELADAFVERRTERSDPRHPKTSGGTP